MRSTRISTFLSDSTRKLLGEYAEAHGLDEGFLIEQALLHHLQALRELPVDVLVPPRLVVSRETGRRILARIRKPRRPTKAMRELFRKRDR